jgi:hypothetical protein
MMQGGAAANQLQSSAFPQWMQAAGAPWQVGQTIGGANLQALQGLGQFGVGAATIPGQQISGWNTALGTMGNLQNQGFNQQQAQYADMLQRAQLQMQAAQQDAAQQSAALGGIGKIAGTLGGFALGGPMGAMIGGGLGGSLFGGGGGGGGSGMPMGWGAGAPSSWYQPFGGMFSGGGGGSYAGGSMGGVGAGNPFNVTGSLY